MKHPAYSAYKPADADWLNALPSAWNQIRGRFVMAVNPPARRARVLDDTDEVSFVPMEAVGEYGGLDLERTKPLDEIGSGYTAFEDGDVVIAKITPCFENGKGAIASGLKNGVGFGTTELHVLRTGKRLDRQFLFYLTISHTFRMLGESEMYGAGGQKRVPPEFAKDFRIPLPPVDEQETIARFLDAKTAQIDALLAQKRQLIAKLKEKRQALIARTVTRGLPPDAAVAAGLEPNPVMKDSGVDWLGQVPRHWHVDRLKWSTKGCYNGVWGDEPNEIDDLICVRVADFDRDRFIVISSPPTIRAIETGQRRNRILQKNDLLIEKSGGGEKQLVGCVVQFTEDLPAVCSNFVARLPVASGCNARYLIYLHSTIYAARLNYPAIKQTTGIQNLDSSEYLNISVAYPPIPEQAAIAAYLDAQSAQIDTLLAKTEAAITRLAEYRLALITSAVTGKIDVRGWTQQHKAGGKAFGAPNNTIKTEAAQAGLVA